MTSGVFSVESDDENEVYTVVKPNGGKFATSDKYTAAVEIAEAMNTVRKLR